VTYADDIRRLLVDADQRGRLNDLSGS
jgi:hypothetical protein